MERESLEIIILTILLCFLIVSAVLTRQTKNLNGKITRLKIEIENQKQTIKELEEKSSDLNVN